MDIGEVIISPTGVRVVGGSTDILYEPHIITVELPSGESVSLETLLHAHKVLIAVRKELVM